MQQRSCLAAIASVGPFWAILQTPSHRLPALLPSSRPATWLTLPICPPRPRPCRLPLLLDLRRSVPLWSVFGVWRGVWCVRQTAVEDCLERVLGPGSEPASSFAVVFFEGHDQGGVQDALNSFAERWGVEG